MERLLRRFPFFLALLFALYGTSFAWSLHNLGQPVLDSRTVWAALAAAVFFATVAPRFSLAARFQIFLLVLSLGVVEVILQVLAWGGVLPGVNTMLKSPYARVYWTGEGRGNGIRNRFGWNYPEFDLEAKRRIAYIGDSQVEAAEVGRTRNQAYQLQTLLREKSPDWSVLGLGSHGICPAHSMDMLEYAARHFHPQEAIVVISIGSDVIESSPALNPYPPEQYIYYDLDAHDHLVLNPRSTGIRDRMFKNLELNHRPVIYSLETILESHCMLLQAAHSLRSQLATRRQQAANARLAASLQEKEGAEFARLGFNPAPFAIQRGPEVEHAMKVLLAELLRCQEICAARGMALRLVTIPVMPKVFYDSQHGRDWTLRIGYYDYQRPETEIAEFAAAKGIPFLGMGGYIQRRRMDVEEIRALFFSNGSGHLTEKGHALCAQAIYETFYR